MNIFEIAQFTCSYQEEGRAVLFIDRLNIPAGKLTVILGQSGSGKSTLIEALGLMNNTIRGGTARYNSPTGPVDLPRVWQKYKELARIRKECFSFIFQDDYLMPHYTCSENMLIARLIQGKIESERVSDILTEPMDVLHLSGSGIKTKFPYEVAGGQRQRLSFTRAVLKNYNVLFGDEPTGNLDPKNSLDLFEFIRKKIKDDHSSAVIVSHNIELSVEKADNIIVLTRQETETPALFIMKPEHFFTRENYGWVNYTSPHDLVNYIHSII
ncbi:MAG: ATP-binding cassette domain-containing protein [Bacteroidetes bacterium]|nr:ATP-binding cassette domain-containing protein [Bacteroidota bacterium]